MNAHIGSATDGSGLIVVWCDRHGDVLGTDSLAVAEAMVSVHDNCRPREAPTIPCTDERFGHSNGTATYRPFTEDGAS